MRSILSRRLIFWLAGILVCLAWEHAGAAYVQEPDANGWAIPSYAKPLTLSDDWVSPFTGPITGLRFWVAWAGDQEDDYAYLPALVDISADEDLGGGMHVPGNGLWSGETQTDALAGTVDQGWFSPDQSVWGGPPGEMVLHDHTRLRETRAINISQPPSVEQGVTYWITMYVWTDGGVLGWSTSASHAGMPASYRDPFLDEWKRLTDPLTGEPLDLAFEVVPEPASLLLLGLGGLAAVRQRRSVHR